MSIDSPIDTLLHNGRATLDANAKIYGVVPALVTGMNDPKGKRHMMGMIQVYFPWLQNKSDPALINPWARVGMPNAGGTAGWYTIPQIGDEVVVGFQHGDPNFPYVIGSLWNGASKVPMPQTDSDSTSPGLHNGGGDDKAFSKPGSQGSGSGSGGGKAGKGMQGGDDSGAGTGVGDDGGPGAAIAAAALAAAMGQVTAALAAGAAGAAAMPAVMGAAAAGANGAAAQSKQDATKPAISLTPAANTEGKTYITVALYKAGTKNFSVSITTTNLKQVTLTTSPAQQMSAAGVSGNGSITIPVTSGQAVDVSVAAPLTMKQQVQPGLEFATINCHNPDYHRSPDGQPWPVIVPHNTNGEERCTQKVITGPNPASTQFFGWNKCCAGPGSCYSWTGAHCTFCCLINGTQNNNGGASLVEIIKRDGGGMREAWTGGNVNLTASGDGVQAQVVLNAQSWAQDIPGLPPPPMVHGAC